MTAPASSPPPRDLGDFADRVRSKGREEAEKILAEARVEAQEIVSKAEAEVKALLLKAAAEAEHDSRLLEQHELSGAELESIRKRLLAQRQVLDTVYSAALGRLAELPEDKRRALFGKLLVRAKKDVPSGGAYCAERDKAQAEAAGYRHLGALPGRGGLVVESADARFRVDLRYETILQETWARSVKDVVAALNA